MQRENRDAAYLWDMVQAARDASAVTYRFSPFLRVLRGSIFWVLSAFIGVHRRPFSGSSGRPGHAEYLGDNLSVLTN